MKLLPKARTADIVIQDLKAEVLIYDLKTDQAFCLNSTSANVFYACDGVTTFDELKAKYKLTDEIIYLALDGLQKNSLLAENYILPFAGMNRREIMKRVGLATSTLVALPFIVGVAAPTATVAASASGANNGVACTTISNSSRECKSGRCTATTAFTYNPATGMNFSMNGANSCCVAGGGNITGQYTNGSTAGNCNFAGTCCTGSGVETNDAVNLRYVCTCAAIS